MVKDVMIECQECGNFFVGQYDDYWETEDDAAWSVSCVHCGDILCPSCSRYHDCVAEDDFYDEEY